MSLPELAISSVEPPLSGESAGTALRLVVKAQYVGALGSLPGPRPLTIDVVTVTLQGLAELGVGQSLPERFASAVSANNMSAMRGVLEEADQMLEGSPRPQATWPVMRSALGDDTLARIVGVTQEKLREYAEGSTPADVAARLHYVALVSCALAGSYTSDGIAQWWQRPRTDLQGKTPQQTLAGQRTDSSQADAVRSLAGDWTPPASRGLIAGSPPANVVNKLR